MKKRDELAIPTSCLNKAADDEYVFVLRAKDPEFSGTIRDWVLRRLRSGKNTIRGLKIIEALSCAWEADGVKFTAATKTALSQKIADWKCELDRDAKFVAPVCGASSWKWVVFQDLYQPVIGSGANRRDYRLAVREYLCECGRQWCAAVGVDDAGNPTGEMLPAHMMGEHPGLTRTAEAGKVS